MKLREFLEANIIYAIYNSSLITCFIQSLRFYEQIIVSIGANTSLS